MDRPAKPDGTPELSWVGSHKYIVHLSSLANIRACDTPDRSGDSQTAVVPEREVAAWQTLLAVADPRVVEGAVGGHYPGRQLARAIAEQAERQGSGREQPALIQDRLPYLRELEGLIDSRLTDTDEKPVVPMQEVEAWGVLLEPVGDMADGQPGRDIFERITTTIASQAERH